jgi:hypothetical protein
MTTLQDIIYPLAIVAAMGFLLWTYLEWRRSR